MPSSNGLQKQILIQKAPVFLIGLDPSVSPIGKKGWFGKKRINWVKCPEWEAVI